MKSKIFYTKKSDVIVKRLLALLQKQTPETLGITKTVREAGDRIGTFISDNFKSILSTDGKNVLIDRKYKKLANVSFQDEDGITYYINVMSHNIKGKFSRPNVTSVDRLSTLYKDDKNIFIILLVDYDPTLASKNVVKITMLPIEFLSWDCLSFGLLGKGQIQIIKASKLTIINKNSRRQWMLDFAKYLNRFYVNSADKIIQQLKLAIKIDDEWSAKKDIWK